MSLSSTPVTAATCTPPITRLHGGVDGLSIGLCGDLKNGRTVHSLIKAMEKFKNVKFFCIAPRELAIPEYMRVFMREHNIPFTEVTGLEAVIPQLDVLYMTRIQRERFDDPEEYERLKDSYVLTAEKMTHAKADMAVLHPLPRVNEISVRVDEDPRAAYFRQTLNGKYMRMALILKLLGEAKADPIREAIDTEGWIYDKTCLNPKCICRTEQELPQAAKLAEGTWRCVYCEQKVK